LDFHFERVLWPIYNSALVMEPESKPPNNSLRSSWKEGQMDQAHTLPGWNPEAWHQLNEKPVLSTSGHDGESVRLKCRISSALDDMDDVHIVCH
jgi:hypothetical protein